MALPSGALRNRISNSGNGILRDDDKRCAVRLGLLAPSIQEYGSRVSRQVDVDRTLQEQFLAPAAGIVRVADYPLRG